MAGHSAGHHPNATRFSITSMPADQNIERPALAAGDLATWRRSSISVITVLKVLKSVESCRLTGQSLLRAERNSNKCNWSTARKKIGPVNRPCDRPIDVFSIASLMFWVTSRLADQRKNPTSNLPSHSHAWLSQVIFTVLCGGRRQFFPVSIWSVIIR